MNETVVNTAAEQAGKLASKLDGIFDVLPPAMPVHTAYDNLFLFSVTGLLLLVISAILIWRYHSGRGKASRELRSLSRLLQQQDSDHRQAAYTLAGILRSGLKLNRLSLDTRLPSVLSSEHSRWQQYVELMARARYSRNGSDPDGLNQLVHETRYWLRRWP